MTHSILSKAFMNSSKNVKNAYKLPWDMINFHQVKEGDNSLNLSH